MGKTEHKQSLFERCFADGCKGHTEIIVVFTECQSCEALWRFDRADDDLKGGTVHFTHTRVEEDETDTTH